MLPTPELDMKTVNEGSININAHASHDFQKNDFQKNLQRKNLQRKRIQSKQNNPWQSMSKSYDDFAASFLPTDDIYAQSGSGGDDIPSLAYFQFLAERRIGIAWRITKKPAEDAIRNRFRIMDFKGKINERDDIFDWCENTDFYNQLAQALYYERVYGIAFLMKYYTKNDKEFEDFSEPITKGSRPIAFQAFPPTHMSPVNVHETSYLDSDPQKWDIQGGIYNPQRIHHSRIDVIMTRRVSHRWRGLSVFEPIWHSILSYFQAIIYTLRAFNKVGSSIPYWLIDTNLDLAELFDKYGDLLDEMKMNGIYIGRKGDEIGFEPTNISAGLTELMDIWRKDIASGTSFPMPILWGEAVSGGMGSQMYLVFERYYWNEISNIQASLSDDVLRILKDAGFKDLEKRRIDWLLAMTKTDAQRLADELMEKQVEMADKQKVLLDIEIERGKIEVEMLEFQHLNNMLNPEENEEGETSNTNKPKNKNVGELKDFRQISKNRLEAFFNRNKELFKQFYIKKEV